MANLEKIVKVTQEQYDILASGGTVGEYTGLNENYIYLIKEDKDWAYLAQFLFDESDADWASTITNDQRKILEEHDSVYVILYGTDRYILTKTYQDNSSMSFVASSDANDFVYLDVNDTTITVKYGARLDYEKYNNLVTKNTNQIITGQKTIKGVPLIFSNSSGTEVGRIEYDATNAHFEIKVTNSAGNSYLGTSAYRWGYVFTDNLRLGSKSYNYIRAVNDSYLEISSNNGIIRSTSSFIPNNADNDLGTNNNRWRDAHIARYLSDGTNTVTIAEIQKKYISKKTFTGVIAQSTTNTIRYFGRILPVSYTNLCSIHYKEKVTIPGHPEYTMVMDCRVCFQNGAVRSYYSYNEVSSSYMPISYHYTFLPTTTGISAGYGIPLGEQLNQHTTESDYARTFEIEILEVENCSFEFFDLMLINTAVPGYTTTNTNFTTQTGSIWAEWLSPGLVESGDRNDTYYISDTYSRHPAGTNGIKGLQFIMQKRDGTWESITTTNGQGTSKTLNRSGFLPDRLIWYNSSTDVSSGAYTGIWMCYYVYNIDRRYVDNAGTLTSKQYNDYYFKGHLVDGLFYFDTTQWWSFELPTTDDGFVYILVGNLGQNNNGNQLAISKDHPMYKYDASVGGVVEVYAGQSQVKRYI